MGEIDRRIRAIEASRFSANLRAESELAEARERRYRKLYPSASALKDALHSAFGNNRGAWALQVYVADDGGTVLVRRVDGQTPVDIIQCNLSMDQSDIVVKDGNTHRTFPGGATAWVVDLAVQRVAESFVTKPVGMGPTEKWTIGIAVAAVSIPIIIIVALTAAYVVVVGALTVVGIGIIAGLFSGR